ncbi:Phosphomannomutase [Candidatus Methylobacter favarea]|uniref:Phosphomannomutase n=2 Tax=Candidatus Methylobacter favarea TaxID=2707345 RepID=A0A8S0XSJ6_9GAMM|nr:Phosphomannomutase [Candidatus Methylobacter favarea]
MPMRPNQQKSLRQCLAYEPRELQFGTSGRRGEVVHLTQLEVFINAVAELEFLQSLSKAEGGIARGEEFFYARDLRPSSSAYVAEQQGRGELAQAIEQAILYAGMIPVNEGMIPTPALTHYALAQGKGSMMVTGSHIPFDRNGYKTNTSRGELLKQHERPVNEKVKEVRQRFYEQPFDDSLFGADGLFKTGSRALSVERREAASAYIQRYVDFFGKQALAGMRLLTYQHSAVGRDMLVDILRALGAEVVIAGRSETFVPIDTENMDAGQLAVIQKLYDEEAAQYGQFDAVVSTDGDSDRPLILGVEAETATVHFFGGDLIGMLTAELLGADAVVVPISSNDGIDRGKLKDIIEAKTRIGSPYVIAGMEKALARGKKAVCGWEANGGFLTGSDIFLNGQVLTALPTRDAVLPILAVLFIARRDGAPLTEIFTRLPKRYSRAALIKQFPRTLGLEIVKRFSPSDEAIQTAAFLSDDKIVFMNENNKEIAADTVQKKALETIRQELEVFFSPELGFGKIERINYVDGVRMYFSNGDLAHLRPSGNADELRIYAVADTQGRADKIAAMAIAEPDGLLRRLAAYVR